MSFLGYIDVSSESFVLSNAVDDKFACRSIMVEQETMGEIPKINPTKDSPGLLG
jgi:hypothetical protein